MGTKQKKLTTRHLYWHFLPEDKRLYGCGQCSDRKVVRKGSHFKIDDEPVLCRHGFHASYRAIDALQYAPGPVICRVRMGGILLADGDKVVAQERTVLAIADATSVLHEFACRCAEKALKTAKVEDVRCWQAIETKRKWLRGEATDDELAAARDAAWAAAWAAARAAAWDAARAAAWAAARDAAWDAAWAAAWDEQNRVLESLLLDLLKT